MTLGIFIGLNIVSIIALTAMYFMVKEIIRVAPTHKQFFV
jgi:hypothetical protein